MAADRAPVKCHGILSESHRYLDRLVVLATFAAANHGIIQIRPFQFLITSLEAYSTVVSASNFLENTSGLSPLIHVIKPIGKSFNLGYCCLCQNILVNILEVST